MTRPATDGDAHRSARLIYSDVVATLTHLSAALREMRDAMPGYPSVASGADSDGGGGDGSSSTERAALGHSEARQARGRLLALLGDISIRTHELRDISTRWGQHHGARPSDRKGLGLVRERDDLWCQHCQQHGHLEPRQGERRYCGWCYSFLRANGQLPPKALLEIHWQGRHITEADVARHLGRRRTG